MTGKREIEAAERTRLALELRLAGHTYQAIADQFGYANRSGVYKAIAKAVRAIPAEAAAELRVMELCRLDAMFVPHYRRAVTGNGDDTLKCLKIMERRAKLLGLDAPAKREDPSEGYTTEVRIIGVDASKI